MANQLSVEDVSEFLKQNPEFLNNWLSSRGLSELADERNRKSKTAHVIGNAFLSYVQDVVQKKRVPQTKLIYSEVNKNDLFKELVRDIADELDVNLLSHKIIQNVCILTRSDRGSLFLVRRSASEHYLVSKLFDVTATSVLDDSLHVGRNAIHIAFGEGIVGTVAETRKSINIKDAYSDPRFNKEVDLKTGYHTKCMMALPIFGMEEDVVGVACVINKTDGEYFTMDDEGIFKDYLAFCGIGINNAQLFEIKVEEFKRNQLLLNLVKQITRELANLPKMVEVILKQALDMLDCQCATVFLLEVNSAQYFSHVFELSNGVAEVTQHGPEHILCSIARKCILSGEMIYNPTIFDTGKNANAADLFCINIMNAASVCIGCIIFNRTSNDLFSRSDIEMMETFALFCGIGLQNAQNYDIAIKYEAQKQIALDVLATHTLAPIEEVARIMSLKMIELERTNIYKFDFNDMEFTNDETVLVCAQLFIQMRTLEILEIPLDMLIHFILTVKKNYRQVIYHNWRHGLNVAQTMFCMLTTGNMREHFSDNDCVYLMVASLCHDLDHRGTNNAFQVKIASPLASLYSTSVMEHHHIDRSLMILNESKTNIFKNLSTDEYKHGLKMVEHAILSTDLVLYFEKRNQFKHLVENGEKNFSTAAHLDLLLSMMMTACDLSAITKPWKVQRKVALIVAREFYYQGDMEKEIADSVIPLMDRDKRHDLPKMQVSFIDFVCVMVYKYLSEMNEKLSPLYEGCLRNRENWGNIAAGKAKFDVDKRIEKQEMRDDFFLFESADDEAQYDLEEIASLEVLEETGGGDQEKKTKEEEEAKKKKAAAEEEEKKKKAAEEKAKEAKALEAEKEKEKKAEEMKKEEEEEEQKAAEAKREEKKALEEKAEEEKKKKAQTTADPKKPEEAQASAKTAEAKPTAEPKKPEEAQVSAKPGETKATADSKKQEEAQPSAKSEETKTTADPKKPEAAQVSAKPEQAKTADDPKNTVEVQVVAKPEESKIRESSMAEQNEEIANNEDTKGDSLGPQNGPDLATPSEDGPQRIGAPGELKSHRTYRQPENPVIQRRVTVKACYDELAEEQQKRLVKRTTTLISQPPAVQPLVIKRKSTVIVPPNPSRPSRRLPDDSGSNESPAAQRLSTFTEFSSSSLNSEGDESSEMGTTIKLPVPANQPVRKLTNRASRQQVPSINQRSGQAMIAEDDEEEDDSQGRLKKRITGPQRYISATPKK